jgi:hypothetical protein
MKKLTTTLLAITFVMQCTFASEIYILRSKDDVDKVLSAIKQIVKPDTEQATKIEVLLNDSYSFVAELKSNNYTEKQYAENRIFVRQEQHIENSLQEILGATKYKEYIANKQAIEIMVKGNTK